MALTLVITACQETGVDSEPINRQSPPPTPTEQAQESTGISLEAVASIQAPASPTPLFTSTPMPDPTSTSEPIPLPEPKPMPTSTPVGSCSDRWPSSELTELVTLEYGISREYAPSDLVALSDYLPVAITLGYPTMIREIAAESLVEMVSDMLEAGLQPTIISGYRSYSSQSIAWNKWLDKQPERASIISAPPGHSEHQLGTTVDFGSPELPALVGDNEIEFHTNFYMTSEGDWLAKHAHEYGFVLSFPRETFELTGMYYEPWHFRFVGREMAATLHEEGISLISYLMSTQPPPCIP